MDAWSGILLAFWALLFVIQFSRRRLLALEADGVWVRDHGLLREVTAMTRTGSRVVITMSGTDADVRSRSVSVRGAFCLTEALERFLQTWQAEHGPRPDAPAAHCPATGGEVGEDLGPEARPVLVEMQTHAAAEVVGEDGMDAGFVAGGQAHHFPAFGFVVGWPAGHIPTRAHDIQVDMPIAGGGACAFLQAGEFGQGFAIGRADGVG
jgi:hypothetical protein